jgi:hypothetical protein
MLFSFATFAMEGEEVVDECSNPKSQDEGASPARMMCMPMPPEPRFDETGMDFVAVNHGKNQILFNFANQLSSSAPPNLILDDEIAMATNGEWTIYKIAANQQPLNTEAPTKEFILKLYEKTVPTPPGFTPTKRRFIRIVLR